MEEEDSLISSSEDRALFNQFIAQGGAPSFIARAARAQQAWEIVKLRCHVHREELLELVKSRLGKVCALAGEWSRLSEWLSAPQIEGLKRLHETFRPRLRLPVTKADTPRQLQRALVELIDSIDRFNARWKAFLESVDLAPVNELREKYNKYYVFEKECVVRSPVIARRHFTPLQPLQTSDLEEEFPLLPELVLS